MMQNGVCSVGSVVGFVPVVGMAMTWWRLDAGGRPMPGLKNEATMHGWGTVVVDRDGWVMGTRIEPIIVCCGILRGAITHLLREHGVDFSDEEKWEWSIVPD